MILKEPDPGNAGVGNSEKDTVLPHWLFSNH